ncbi:MAG: DUF5060 domain-containing protein [Bacteroidales bacterium]|nr:DUF5060 domain-containing protein [Bacteroidales bacterium]
MLTTFMMLAGCSGSRSYSIDGERMTWHTITISFEGLRLSEEGDSNPFLNYRLMVDFMHGDDTITVPGFFAADGRAAKSGSSAGSVWQVRFKPWKEGEWHFKASFRKGPDIAISTDSRAGSATAFDGASGRFFIGPTDKSGRDFRAHGRLEYTGERYLRFAESGDYFLKGGADSPENFLAYHEFDGTLYNGNNQRRMGEDHPNADLHHYRSHVQDWKSGDPLWREDKGKGIIGALNYLASEGMNSVYFLTMNVDGDGEDVWPWTSPEERYRFDCSKLDQWEIVFSHMEQMGIMMHMVLQETENECLLDSGKLGLQRKLYLRELIARFSHHLAVTWNIGEENGPASWTPLGQTVADRKEMMRYIRNTNPWNSFIVVHTHSADPDHSALIEPFLGFENLDGPSLQLHKPAIVHNYTRKWISLSEKQGKQWVVCLDEIGPYWMGVMPDKNDPLHDTIRREVLWGNLMAGGAGVEWYFGYRYDHADLNCEDWRSREHMWKQTRIALGFFRGYLPFREMNAHDELTDNGYCLASPGKIYAIYLPYGGTCSLNLSSHPDRYAVFWFNPRREGSLLPGTITTLQGGADMQIGLPPEDTDRDWVCLVRRL